MSQLEYGIHKLSDARLRQWLRASTGTSLGSVSTGVVTTALLQSSSMVSLLVLAFASAGLLPLFNAIGIILGANLGTTFTGWVVAIFGFKLDLEAMALPLLGVSAFFIVFSKRDSRINYAALVALGIGLLLFGLGVMKGSMETIPERWDVSLIQGHHPIVYLVFGVFITFLVQSSSAVMMMALAAVNSGFIALPEAVALVIGADLGTTSTTVLASITGSTIKRQLALAHCTFNLVVDMAAFLFLLPALPLLLSLLNISDPLFGLVAFHSVMNLLGLLAFIPFLSLFSRWIEKLFARWAGQPKTLLEAVPADVVDAALVALRRTVRSVVLQAAFNAMRAFSLHPERMKAITELVQKSPESIAKLDFNKGYEYLKNQEGNVLRYSSKIQAQPLEEHEVMELEQLQSITRPVIYCNKTLKDIQRDLQELKHGDIPAMVELYEQQRAYHRDIYQRVIDLLVGDHGREYVLEELDELHEINDKHYDEVNQFVYSQAGVETTDGTLVSMQLNVNREVRLAFRSMLKSMRRLIMDQEIVEKMELELT